MLSLGDLDEVYKTLPPKTLEFIETLRKNEIMYIMELQFVLSYQIGLSKTDVDNMTIFELENWKELLIKQKNIENENNSNSK